MHLESNGKKSAIIRMSHRYSLKESEIEQVKDEVLKLIDTIEYLKEKNNIIDLRPIKNGLKKKREELKELELELISCSINIDKIIKEIRREG